MKYITLTAVLLIASVTQVAAFATLPIMPLVVGETSRIILETLCPEGQDYNEDTGRCTTPDQTESNSEDGY